MRVVVVVVVANAFLYYKSHCYQVTGSVPAQSVNSPNKCLYYIWFVFYCLILTSSVRVISSSWNAALKWYFSSKIPLHCWHWPHQRVLTHCTSAWTPAFIFPVLNHTNFGSCVQGCWVTSAADNVREKKRRGVREEGGVVKKMAKPDCTCSWGRGNRHRKIK